jgi:hypothetical protein
MVYGVFLLMHMIDQLVGLFGPNCSVDHVALLKTRSGAYNVEDTAHIQLTFTSSAGNVAVNLMLTRAAEEAEELI